jgi:O-acetyl-ADP-ribose deacetylase (regulator of RNase III)
MTLKYKVGCLIEAAQSLEVQVIAHQCNCHNTMGSGIAPLIAKAFPSAEQADNRTVAGDIRKLGHYTHATIWLEYFEDLEIFNLYGQYNFTRGLATDYEALRSALRGMSFRLLGWNLLSIGLPKLGAGLGGGDWRVIEGIIREELDGFDVTIYVLDEGEIPDANRNRDY